MMMQQYQPSSLRSKSDGDSCLFGIVDTLAAVDCFEDPKENGDVFSTSSSSLSSDAGFFGSSACSSSFSSSFSSSSSSSSPTFSSSASSSSSAAFSSTYPTR